MYFALTKSCVWGCTYVSMVCYIDSPGWCGCEEKIHIIWIAISKQIHKHIYLLFINDFLSESETLASSLTTREKCTHIIPYEEGNICAIESTILYQYGTHYQYVFQETKKTHNSLRTFDFYFT